MRILATALLTAILLSVSGSTAVASSHSGQGTDSKLCMALAKIGRLDGRFTDALTNGDSWDEAREQLESIGPRINKAWRTVVRRIPDKHLDAAELVAAFTKRALVKLADADSLSEAGSVVTDDPDAIAAGLASLELDTFSRDTCDVSINNE